MNRLSLLTEQLLFEIQKLELPVISILNEGLSLEKLLTFSTNSGYKLPENVVELYLWRNGTSLNKKKSYIDMEFFPYYYFMSFDNAINVRASLIKQQKIFKNFLNSKTPFKENFFPIFNSLDTTFILVDCEKGNDSPLFEYITETSSLRICYDNIEAFLETLIECYKRRIYFKDKKNHLTVDLNREIDVIRTINKYVQLG